jgi:hypothetical protein
MCYDYELQTCFPFSLYTILCGILFQIYAYKVLEAF